MPFYSPVPWEVDRFYHQAGMEDNNITLDWYPVGTGAFMMTDNNPNKQTLKNVSYFRDSGDQLTVITKPQDP